LAIEEAEDAERRQQITWKFDGGWSASKAGSGKGSACARTLVGLRSRDQGQMPP
jgi:hypothetical protein